MLGKLVIWGGVFLCILGLIGLAQCVRRALQVKRGEIETADADSALNRLVALNMASVGTAFFGLALVVIGLML